jgi:hypothetical protein
VRRYFRSRWRATLPENRNRGPLPIGH